VITAKKRWETRTGVSSPQEERKRRREEEGEKGVEGVITVRLVPSGWFS